MFTTITVRPSVEALMTEIRFLEPGRSAIFRGGELVVSNTSATFLTPTTASPGPRQRHRLGIELPEPSTSTGRLLNWPNQDSMNVCDSGSR